MHEFRGVFSFLLFASVCENVLKGAQIAKTTSHYNLPVRHMRLILYLKRATLDWSVCSVVLFKLN